MNGTAALIGAMSLAAVAGISFVLQQAVNAELRMAIGSAAWAGFASYVGGSLCMLLLALGLGDPLPSGAAVGRAPLWAWTGGIFGALYIAISILLLRRLGTASFIALFVAGQMLASLVIDQLGAFGTTPEPLDARRMLGAALLVGGVALLRF